ncbi:CotY/CotZ family spore coat protein [Neobacillus sp. Marseille-QA0830]
MKKMGTTQNSCLIEALLEVQKLEELLTMHSTPILGNFLERVLQIDTIPFILLTNTGPFELSGVCLNEQHQKRECFTTSFFKLVSVNEDTNCVNLLLLRPLNACNQPSKSVCDVFRLEKTPICVEVNLDCVCGIQSFHPNLLKKEIIIEPKW